MIALVLALWLLASPAAAHGAGIAAAPGFDPVVWVPLVALALLYPLGALRRRGRIAPYRPLCFGLGLGALAIAASPLMAPLSARFFAAHMVEHELLMVVAAPLLTLARPLGPLTRALPRALRRGAAGLLRAVHGMAEPLAASLLQAVVLWAWHVPLLFQAALSDPALHRLQHASFLGAALLFWQAMFRRAGAGVAAMHLFLTSVHASLLGAVFVFSTRPWYPLHAAAAQALGLSALEDQQLGGLVMWMAACSVYVLAALWLTGQWIRRSGAQAAPGEVHA